MSLTPLRALKKMVVALQDEDCLFCLVGGHAASLYRAQERFTRDVDFAILTSPPKKSRSVASSALRAIGLRPIVGFIPLSSTEEERKSICMVTSEPPTGHATGLVDVLLPELPWVKNAVLRAQNNLIDLGFAHVPVITPEDLLIAKCFSFRNAPDRFQDLDDLKEILTHVEDLDIDYLMRTLDGFSLVIPEQVRKFAPKGLLREE